MITGVGREEAIDDDGSEVGSDVGWGVDGILGEGDDEDEGNDDEEEEEFNAAPVPARMFGVD